MKINSIVNRYIFKEMIPPFVINVVFFVFVFLMIKILDITNLIVNYRISFIKILLLLASSMPFFLVFVIPMSVMMAVLLTFLRLSNDNEILALKSGGVSLYGLLPPVILFCLMGYVLTAVMSIYGMPWGITSFERLVYDVAASNLNIGLKEKTFNDRFKGVMLYTNKIDLRNNTLIDVFIEDQRHDKIVSTIVAPKGELFSAPGATSFSLRLSNGIINQVNMDQKTVNSVNFETYELMLDLKQAIATAKRESKKDEKEMSIRELRDYLKSAEVKDTQYFKTLIEFHNKFSIPFACFSLGILAIPLGVQSRATKRSYGLGLGVVFFLMYYLLLSLGWVFGETGYYPPFIGLWVPNGVMGGLGVFLLIRTATENPVRISFIGDWIKQKVSRVTG